MFVIILEKKLVFSCINRIGTINVSLHHLRNPIYFMIGNNDDTEKTLFIRDNTLNIMTNYDIVTLRSSGCVFTIWVKALLS